jgi:hypothetical protein
MTVVELAGSILLRVNRYDCGKFVIADTTF